MAVETGIVPKFDKFDRYFISKSIICVISRYNIMFNEDILLKTIEI
jgi:hypothetical protein